MSNHPERTHQQCTVGIKAATLNGRMGVASATPVGFVRTAIMLSLPDSPTSGMIPVLFLLTNEGTEDVATKLLNFMGSRQEKIVKTRMFGESTHTRAKLSIGTSPKTSPKTPASKRMSYSDVTSSLPVQRKP